MTKFTFFMSNVKTAYFSQEYIKILRLPMRIFGQLDLVVMWSLWLVIIRDS